MDQSERDELNDIVRKLEQAGVGGELVEQLRSHLLELTKPRVGAIIGTMPVSASFIEREYRMRLDPSLPHLVCAGAIFLAASSAACAQDLAPGAQVQPMPHYFSAKELSDFTPDDALWALFSTVSSNEKVGAPGDGVRGLVSLGLDDASAHALFGYITDAISQQEQADIGALADACGARDQIVTKDDLLRQTLELKRVSDTGRASAVAGVQDVIDAAAYAKVREAAEEIRTTMQGVKIDYAAAIAAQPDSAVADAMDRLCGSADRDSASRGFGR